MRQVLVAIGLLLCVASHVRGQVVAQPAYSDLLLPSANTAPPVSAAPVENFAPPNDSPNVVVIPPQQYTPMMAPGPPPIGEPPWCESPYRSTAWRVQFDLIPTVSDVSDQAFGDWDDNGGLALRLGLGYEDEDGVGMRAQFWGFGRETSTFIDDVELDASTFYWDFYKRFYIQDAELALGGGVAGSQLEYKLSNFGNKARYSGGGISLFGEGFYPLWRFEHTDIGSIGRGRIALMSGRWRDDGMPFVGDTDHDTMTIFEIAWGLELRHRFGRNDERYWYIALTPEFQRWESASLPDVFDPSFQGTNISFGLAW